MRLCHMPHMNNTLLLLFAQDPPCRSRCETVALGNYLKLQQPFVPHRPIQESIARRATTSDGGKEIFGSDGGPMTFLSLEEAGLIEMSNLDMHERFLARLTVSSLNLLRVISEQENVPISDLNAGKICDWFVKDKAKRKEAINSAVLKWDNGHGPGW
ncbi:hypothetical protein O6H91_09G100300 [Diphasiastrum complanatum]|uniref:Uncharacterized protein n=1 Tax=Diphasiastrum complanatum TaxID=34168 RepID=A0ACC2CSS2_DIPCM|nr:hypothetical protein O6H91_09G100300 [Diphasiastrum complanatum]